MAKAPQQARDTFRHGNLPTALVEAALARLEVEGSEELSLRDLARDVGVNHRAVYRHFPDKLTLLARVAEAGWRQLGQEVARAAARRPAGVERLVAASADFVQFARARPNLFLLMAGPRLNLEGAFPELEAAIGAALGVFMQGFRDAGTPAASAMGRAAAHVAALQGIATQILHRRLKVAPGEAKDYVAEICRLLVSGLRGGASSQ